MLYYVIEMQDGAALVASFNRTQYEAGAAVSDFYTKCAYAAISQVHRHTVMFVDDMGTTCCRRYRSSTNRRTLNRKKPD